MPSGGGGSKKPRRAGGLPPAPAVAPLGSWSTVPEDILMMVASILPTFADFQRFRCVCRWWRAVAASLEDARGVCPPLPYLLLPGSGGADDPSRRLYSIPEGKIHRLDFPEESRGWWCHGSSGGWLAMVDVRGGIFLFNPVSGARVSLPDLSKIAHVKGIVQSPNGGSLVWLYKDRFGKTKHRLDWVQANYVQKVVWSGHPGDQDCVVVMLYAGDFRLAYARDGDAKWRRVNTGYWDFFADVMYLEASKLFYAVSICGGTISLKFPAVHGDGRRQRPKMKVFAASCGESDEWVGKYLVGLASGEILLVLSHYHHEFGQEDDVPYPTNHFQVLKCIPGAAKGEWVEVNTLGESALFLGHNNAISLSSSQVLGNCRPNCIYFIDDVRERFRSELECGSTGSDREYRGCDVGVFDMEARIAEPLCSLEAPVVKRTPVWITPCRDFGMPTTVL